MSANGDAPELISAASNLVPARMAPRGSTPCSPSTGYCDPWRWKPFARASSATVPVKRISTTFDRHGKLPSVAPGEVSELAEGARLEIA